ncbi:MAG TPA: M56 family metallopeptidase [Streptosporangiaceae bacterium]|nr:M56 family metallopeptidase [Streptosporangiaceae bacterium]
MAGPADAALLAAVAVGSVRGSAALVAARWPHRSPAAAIVLWQALGLAGGLAAVGALLSLGVPPHSASIADGLARMASGAVSGHLIGSGHAALPALLRLSSLITGLLLLGVLCWVLVAASVTVLYARRRHRVLLALLAHGDPKAPGALVVDHPTAAAYCLPGLRSRIVVSVGALDLLRPAELAAVLEHERAHLRERHDLVLLPFTALRRAFGWSRICSQAQQSVALLIEMLADDRALRVLSPRALAGALARFGTAGSECAPAGSLGMSHPSGEGELAARVSRLLQPAPRLPLPAVAGICCGATLLAAVPLALLALPA